MRWPVRCFFMLLAIAVSAPAFAAESLGSPRITAQGFSIESALQSEPGRFDSVRVRVESPSRIAALLILDGDVEIDLATTTDRSMFALFGLSQRPMNAFDITLDFAPYLNSRLTTAATYRIGITVVDRAGGVAQTSLTATVIDADEDEDVTGDMKDALAPHRLQESMLTLQRQGTGPVEPAGASPFTWVTREAVDVTVRLRAADPRSELRQLDTLGWENIFTHEGLEVRLAETLVVPYIDVPAARNGAAGTVVALSGSDGAALVHVTGSRTSVSPLGTTVTLTASIRY